MDASQRERAAALLHAGTVDGGNRSPVIAQFFVDLEVCGQSEHPRAAHELPDDEADAFGFC